MSNQDTHNHARALPAIAGYRLLRLIGEGGMSIVYLAVQEPLGREVAVKVMRPEALADEVSRRRFENEARTIGRLDHPHIVGIFHIGRTEDGLPYYAMPYLPHGHLGQRDFRGDETRIREILRALLSALGYAHGRGVIHRDVKAENVLFDKAGQPLLADFGIALRRGYGSRVTSAGLAVGSTAYMAPEQARGEEVDPRADLYSVGVLAWEMLTGALPYQAQDALAMAVKHARDPIPRLPPELRHWQRFMDRALAKGPLKRFHDAGDMQQALQQLPGPGTRRRMLALRKAGQALRDASGRVPKAAWIVGALALAGALGLMLRQGGPPAGAEGFFRASAPEAQSAPPGPATASDTVVVEAAAPQSAAGRLIADAQRQMRARRLVQPEGDNAYDSLMAAAADDPEHLELPAAAGALVLALGEDAVRRLRAGDAGGARAGLERAVRLAGLTAPPQSELARVRAGIATEVQARIDEAHARMEREAALRSLAPAEAIAIEASALRRLRARAQAIPALGDTIPGDPGGMTVQRTGDGAYALTRRTISRDEYARFAEATGRETALCRERASVLRVLSRRDWTSPGYAQSGGDAVVCVSWDDADAYARWLGQRNGARYRLPTAAEARGLAPQTGATAVAEWLLDCQGDCRTRAVQGNSWRREQSGPRQTERGYDDVGFRLVREP